MPIKLISVDALAANTGDFHILDCSLVMDKSFDPVERHQATHIAGAHFLTLSDLCDKSSPYFLMMPHKDTVVAHMTNLGVGLSKPIVCYDTQNGIWATRAAFTLNAHGHPDVRVLDGGLIFWQASGKPVESGSVAKGNDTNFGFEFHQDHVALFEEVNEISTGAKQV
jgi:thiosulfate/3-mercaptopyruvate sulfurtransferase